MGRPSIKAERTAEILNAYEQCVARFGIEGATLERVASQAGLARALIRHNVGNRDALFDALVERFFDVSEQRVVDLIAALPERDRAPVLIDILFDVRHGNDTHVLVAEALIAAAADRPALAKRMKNWIDDFVSAIAAVLRHSYPDAAQGRVTAVATGVTGIYFNVDSLAMLGGMTDLRRNSKEAALLLVCTLED
ncbi:TetR/AcrR family transcriptional regulator [Hoeflea poritis]|uniref:TetR/AcrR family transcriptional regulator n=1 Tax=Hoeflea poritis TaxID=2993659 RepID=A0ABT4VTE2_9HYPH|nr:TetR/AcrR family transcriptional regulator [Hoeflea poritis]MDA4847982.1 TetR/AcrR family transcriptional regulator [Hoeflea poritis]